VNRAKYSAMIAVLLLEVVCFAVAFADTPEAPASVVAKDGCQQSNDWITLVAVCGALTLMCLSYCAYLAISEWLQSNERIRMAELKAGIGQERKPGAKRE
jgi:hypothetical protein